MKTLLKLLALASLSFAVNAYALSIDLAANQSTVNLGDEVAVQVRISGLEGDTAVGVYDLQLNYDSSIFSLHQIVWGDAVIGNQLDLLGFGSLQDSSSDTNTLTAFELSFDDLLDLESLQASEFSLFSIILKSIALGTSQFSLTSSLFGDANGSELMIDSINNTQVSVGSVVVPEPSSLLLLFGMLALILVRSRMSQ